MIKFLVPRKKLDRLDPNRHRNQSFHISKEQKVVKAEEFMTWKKADEIIRTAEEEAAAIVAKSQAAFDDEKRRGYQNGINEAKAEQAEHMIEQVARSVDYFETIEKRVVDLVLLSVKKIIYDFRDEERTLAVVKNALSTVRNQKKVVIRVHPSETESVQASVDNLLAEFSGINYIDVVSDSRLSRDGCMLETDIGLVEVSIENQLKAIREAFERVLGRQHGV